MNRTVYRAHKYRIYPTDTQKQKISEIFGQNRYVYNYLLNKWNQSLKETKRNLTYSQCITMIDKLRSTPETRWLQMTDPTVLYNSAHQLCTAFERYQNGKAKCPKFRIRRADQTCTFRNLDHTILLGKKHIALPGLQMIECVVSDHIKGPIVSVSLRHTAADEYYVSVLCREEYVSLKPAGKSIGVDLGLKDLAVTSKGEHISVPYDYAKTERKLHRQQRKLSRKSRLAKEADRPLSQSRNYQKQKVKVARLQNRVHNQRTDHLQKLTTRMIKNYDIICVEDLDIEKMLKTHHRAKAISDASWQEMVRMLKYKAAWNGKQIVEINRYYPSSQLCSACGYRNHKLKNLETRIWVCPQCGVIHDRDENAAVNIEREGLRILNG